LRESSYLILESLKAQGKDGSRSSRGGRPTKAG
jgi:hypothetical protein